MSKSYTIYTQESSRDLGSSVFISLITATYNRPIELARIALPSVLSQTNSNFEWAIVNDGANADTREVISSMSAKFPVKYLETSRLGLGGARNLGLQAASGDLVTYLDDDNAIHPNFIEETIAFFNRNPEATYSMARQRRQRNAVHNRKIVKTGQIFFSPSLECQIKDLLLMEELFDSNGFTHYRQDAPQWNAELKVFADYEYLLKCASIWGEDRFKLNPSVLVDYVQTSNGIIGGSNYGQWSQELEYIWNQRDRYALFERLDPNFLLDLIQKYNNKITGKITAFN